MSNEEDVITSDDELEEPMPSRIFHQLGILCLDGSGSMTTIGDKNISLADSVSLAVKDFLGYFQVQATYKNNFSIAVVTFDHMAKIHTPITELLHIDSFADFNPLKGHGGGTYIGGALEKAEELANQFLSEEEASVIPHDVRIIVMSDGLCGKPDSTKTIAKRLKENDKIIICSTLFTKCEDSDSDEAKEAKPVLLDIASGVNFYKTVYSEKDLRQFFISSMSVKRKFNNGQ